MKSTIAALVALAIIFFLTCLGAIELRDHVDRLFEFTVTSMGSRG